MRKKAVNNTNRSETRQRQPKKMIMSLIDGKQYKAVSNREIKKRNDEYVSWGGTNTFPDHLWHLYSGCSTLQSIINGSTDMTYGNKVEFLNLPSTFNRTNADGDTIEEVFHKLILDYWVFGGFAVQVQYNMLHEMTELIHLDLRRLRSNENKSKFFYSRAWGTYDRGEAVVYYPYDQEDTEHHSQVLFYPGKKTRDLYPVPDWSSAIISAETQIEIKKFHYKTLINNFVVNGILNFFVGDVTDAVKEQTEKAINDKFCGTDNAAQLLISWNKDVNQKIDFVRITDDQFDKKYEALSESVREDIFISLRAIPVLFGMVVQTGFNTQEYEEAFTLYNRIAIQPKQEEMKKVFSKLFGENSISITPFTLSDNKQQFNPQKEEGNYHSFYRHKDTVEIAPHSTTGKLIESPKYYTTVDLLKDGLQLSDISKMQSIGLLKEVSVWEKTN